MKQLHLQPVKQGNGRVVHLADGTIHLSVAPSAKGYTNAQLDDYQGLRRGDFSWKPGVRLSLTARLQGEALDGTAGFGFWNAPFGAGGLGGGRWPVLPAAAWFFFGGPSSNMAFAQGVAGQGWKAACIHGHQAWGYGLIPFAPVGFLLMRNRTLYRRVWPVMERLLGISERELPASWREEWHHYTIEWGAQAILFRIDNEIVHCAPVQIGVPLGVVIWIDNQYLVATPQGKLRFGTVKLPSEQRLEIRSLKIETEP